MAPRCPSVGDGRKCNGVFQFGVHQVFKCLKYFYDFLCSLYADTNLSPTEFFNLLQRVKAQVHISPLYFHIQGAGIATGYELDDGRVGVGVPVGACIFSSPCRPDRFWDPPSLLSNGYPGREADH
jgi:hypothetical protein